MIKKFKIYVNWEEVIADAVEVRSIPVTPFMKSLNSTGVIANYTNNEDWGRFSFVDDPSLVQKYSGSDSIALNEKCNEQKVYIAYTGIYREARKLLYQPARGETFIGWYGESLYTFAPSGTGLQCFGPVSIDGENLIFTEYKPTPEIVFSGNPKLDYIEYGDYN